ncbi:MAG: peptidase U32 family protein [Daejeonella sp.]
MKTPEILAPIGSFECLHAAIQAGTDAVYFGVEQLNMRSKSASAFQMEHIVEISQTSKKNHIKSYLTLNTIIYNHDIRFAHQIIKEARRSDVNAVIAADYAVIQLCRKENVPVHISTQANVSNIESVVFHSQFADLIVLSRELTLKQIADITKEIERRNITGSSGKRLEIEIFVHGSLCMAVSGKCYISIHTQNASANRGACVQNCRRPYKVIDTENNLELLVDNEYIMSAKDLCTIDILDQIVKAGVSMCKIEGRSKSADYVYTTTKCYREAIEAINNGSYTQEKIDCWKKELNSVYNRGFWEGYYLGRRLGEWTTNPGNNATQKKIYIGKANKYYPAINVAEFTIEAGALKVGDKFMITGSKTGILQGRMDQLRVNGIDKNEAQKGDLLTFRITNNKVSKGDKLYKVLSEEHA